MQFGSQDGGQMNELGRRMDVGHKIIVVVIG